MNDDTTLVLLQVDEDGSFSLLDSSSLGGRFFLGLSSYLTGVKVRVPLIFV